MMIIPPHSPPLHHVGSHNLSSLLLGAEEANRQRNRQRHRGGGGVVVERGGRGTDSRFISLPIAPQLLWLATHRSVDHSIGFIAILPASSGTHVRASPRNEIVAARQWILAPRTEDSSCKFPHLVSTIAVTLPLFRFQISFSFCLIDCLLVSLSFFLLFFCSFYFFSYSLLNVQI